MAEPSNAAFRERRTGKGVATTGLRVLAAVAVVATALVAPVPAAAQGTTPPVLVSNEGQTAGTDLATASGRVQYAQSFVTGDNADGYYLSSVEVGIAAATDVTVEVKLLAGGRSYFGRPRAVLATLSAPSSIDNATSTLELFGASDVLLEANSRYWISVSKTAGADTGLSVATTTSEDGVDAASLADWSVGHNVFASQSSRWGDYSSTADANMKIRLRGRLATSREPGPYVSNRQSTPRAAVAKTSSSSTRYATSFLTADRVAGWEMKSVVLSVAAESGTTPRVAIHADSSGSPASSAVTNGTLTAPSGIPTDLDAPDRAVFSAATAVTLQGGTTYWVVLDIGSGSGKVSVGTTAANGMDRSSLDTSWRIGNAMKAYSGSSWSADSEGRSFRVSIHGGDDPFDGEVDVGLPQVGIATSARVFDHSRRVGNRSWQWQRGASSSGPFTNIAATDGGTSNPYTPAASDLGMWLKAKVSYDDAFGSGQTAESVSLNPVLSQPIMSTAGWIAHGFPEWRSTAYGHNVDVEHRVAQAFTAGANPAGYLLRGVRLGLDAYSPVKVGWALHADNAGEPAATSLFPEIAVPEADFDDDSRQYEELTHPGFWLAPATKYWLVVSGGPVPSELLQGGYVFAAHTEFALDLEHGQQVVELDQGSEGDWSLDFDLLDRLYDGTGWTTLMETLQLPGRAVLRMSVLADEFAGPSAPRNLDVSAGNQRVGLFWDAPESEGTSAIVRYEYRYKVGTGSFESWTAVPDSDSDGSRADEREVVVSGLTNGTEHTFEVRAVNASTDGRTAEVTATPNSNIPTLTVAASAAKVTGGIDWVHYTLTRSGSTTDAVTATVRLRPPEGNDWAIPEASLSQEVMLAAGDSAETLSIRLDNSSDGVGFSDTATAGGTLEVHTVGEGLDSIDAAAPVEVVVVPDPAWVVSFENSSYAFAEGSGTSTVTALVTASSTRMAAPSSSDPADTAAGVVSFSVASAGGTATSGSGNDFTAVSATLKPDPGDFAANSRGFMEGSVDVDFTVLEDTAVESDEELTLYLDEATGFATATWLRYRGADGQTGGGGTARSVPVTITDNDAAVSSVSVSSTPALPLNSQTKDTYGRGETINFAAQFTDPVMVTGNPTFTFVLGTGDKAATYAEGSGTDTLTFSYVVQQADSDSGGISWAANKLALAGGTISRAGTSNAATLTHSAQGALVGHKVDGSMAAFTAPQFAAATAARSVAENTGSGNVGAAAAATDADGDAVYHSVTATGTSQAEQEHLAAFNRHFVLNATTGQITVGSGADLDYEARSS